MIGGDLGFDACAAFLGPDAGLREGPGREVAGRLVEAGVLDSAACLAHDHAAGFELADEIED